MDPNVLDPPSEKVTSTPFMCSPFLVHLVFERQQVSSIDAAPTDCDTPGFTTMVQRTQSR